MIKCTVCWAWQPTQWDPHKGHWGDTVAKCEIKNKFTTSGESCPDGCIVKPRALVGMKVLPPTNDPKTVDEVVATAEHKPVANNIGSGELYAHQKEAFERFKDANEMALFMEMGTGKSATVLRIVGHKFKQGKIDALLIVAPNDVHVQWAKEQIPLWLDCPYDIQCLFGRGGAKVAYPFTEDEGFLQVVVVNIDTFSTPEKWKDIAEWANNRRTFIILDEATVIKSVDSQRTQRMLYAFNDVVRHGKVIKSSKPRSVGRAILTGTPVTNGPMDMWAMAEFLRPNFFNRNWYSFKAHFGMFTNMLVNDRVIQVPLSEEMWQAIKACPTYAQANSFSGCSEDTYNTIHSQEKYEGPYKHADELKRCIEPISYFKQLKECVDMPPQVYNTKLLTMPPEIQRCYDEMAEELITEYEGKVASAKNKLTAIIRLQQISSGFICDKQLADEVETENDEEPSVVERMFGLMEDEDLIPNDIQWIGKSNPKLDMMYRDVDETVKPVIIITRFTAEASRIYDDLAAKHRVCLITGWKRVGSIDEFKEGKFDVMVANIAAIARGFNLQNSHAMFFYSNTHSLELRLQAEGRIFRLGQEFPCEYTDYTYADSIDEKVVASLRMKRNLLDYIRSAEMKEVVL